MSDLQKRHESDIIARRAKLAALLASEDKQYEVEFMNSLETPEQVRAKMADRLNEIKKKRNIERDQLVNQAYERKFKMETDDLRKEETKFMIAGCQLEREKQLLDKRSKLEQAIAEEQVYAKLWMLDGEKKSEREREEAIEKDKRIKDTMNILTW